MNLSILLEEVKGEDAGIVATKDINHGLAQNRRQKRKGKGLKGTGKEGSKGKGERVYRRLFQLCERDTNQHSALTQRKVVKVWGYGKAKGNWEGSQGWPSVRSLEPHPSRT